MEVDRRNDAEGLQVVDNFDKRHGNAPEVVQELHEKQYYAGTAPASHATTEPFAVTSYAAAELSGAQTRRRPFWRRKRFIIILVVVIIIVIVAAVVGAVVGSRSGNDDKPSTSEVSDGAAQSSESPSSTTTGSAAGPPSTTSESVAGPTLIEAGSTLAAVTWEDIPKEESYSYLAYQKPDGTFQLTRYVKPFSSQDGFWESPRVVEPSSAPRNQSALALSLLRVDSSVYVDMMFVKAPGSIDGAIFEAGSQWKDLTRGMQTDLRKEIEPESNLAALSGLLVYQESDGSLSLRRRTDVGKWVTENLSNDGPKVPKPLKGTKLAIVPLSTAHDNTFSRMNVGLIYQDESGKLVTVPYNATNENNVETASWPSDAPVADLADGGSFAAFSVARSEDEDDERVNTYIVYQDKSSKMKMLWTDDSKKWQESSPEGLKGADKGTSITCSSLGTLRLQNHTRLATASEMTRCYFFEGGNVVSAQLDGEDWVKKGRVPLE